MVASPRLALLSLASEGEEGFFDVPGVLGLILRNDGVILVKAQPRGGWMPSTEVLCKALRRLAWRKRLVVRL